MQVNVLSDTMVKDEGNVAVRNGHLAKRSPQGGPAEATGSVPLGLKLMKKFTKTVFVALYSPVLKPFKKAAKVPFVGLKAAKVPFLGFKTVKNSFVVPVGTILGAATLGGGAIGATTLGTGAIGAATLGAGALGAGTLGAAALGAGAIGTAAVAGTAGVAGMLCMTKTYSNFIMSEIK